MKTTLKHAIIALSVAAAPALFADESDCYKVSESVTKAVTATPDNVLAIVGRQVAASSACSCEIVKAAIVATEADRKLVGQIVATAIDAAPDQMRTIANCAIAVAPDALADVQAILARLEPAGGEGASEKGGYEKGGYAKGGKDPIIQPAGIRNPLDGPYLVPGEPPIHPPFVTPPSTCTPEQFKNIKVR